MKPEDKCVRLETAKKLKEAGFPQDTERWYVDENTIWNHSTRSGKYVLTLSGNCCVHSSHGIDTRDEYAAPDAQEILEVLPTEITETIADEETKFYLTINKTKEIYDVSYDAYQGDLSKGIQTSKNLSECLALIFLYLREVN